MIKVEKGEKIIQQGEKGDKFYLIASGKVSVWVSESGRNEKVAELTPDMYFGEMALITDEPRNATVAAEETTELFVLSKHDFKQIFMKNPVIAEEVKKVFEARKHRSI
jgi:CRP-like cAMP-binding protein